MDNYNKQLENNLLEMVKQKEAADKRLLSLEIIIGVAVSAAFLALIIIAACIQMETWLKIVLIVIGAVPFLIGMVYGLRIEQVAGYYECAKCGHRHIPTYSSVFFAMHIGRTRFMKCPKCGKKSWQKKTLSNEEDQ